MRKGGHVLEARSRRTNPHWKRVTNRSRITWGIQMISTLVLFGNALAANLRLWEVLAGVLSQLIFEVIKFAMDALWHLYPLLF